MKENFSNDFPLQISIEFLVSLVLCYVFEFYSLFYCALQNHSEEYMDFPDFVLLNLIFYDTGYFVWIRNLKLENFEI